MLRKVMYFSILAVLTMATQGCAVERRGKSYGEERHTGIEVIRPHTYEDYHYQANFVIGGAAYLDGQTYLVTESGINVRIDAAVTGNVTINKIEWFKPDTKGNMQKFATGSSKWFNNSMWGKTGRYLTIPIRVDITWVDINQTAVRGTLVPTNADPRYHTRSIVIYLTFVPNK